MGRSFFFIVWVYYSVWRRLDELSTWRKKKAIEGECGIDWLIQIHTYSTHRRAIHHTDREGIHPAVQPSHSNFHLRSCIHTYMRIRELEINIKCIFLILWFFFKKKKKQLEKTNMGKKCFEVKHRPMPLQDQFVQLLSQLFIYFSLCVCLFSLWEETVSVVFPLKSPLK